MLQDRERENLKERITEREDVLWVYMKEPAVTALGPGVRYGLWVMGCDKSCPGCIAAGTHKGTGRKIPVGALAMEIVHSGAEGITISGGEPFLQAGGLKVLIDKVRRKRDMGVIIYSGYSFDQLLKKREWAELLEETDLLIDGPYIRELDDGKSLRGSSNQSVIALTDRYKPYLDMYGSENRETQIFDHGYYRSFVGVPAGDY